MACDVLHTANVRDCTSNLYQQFYQRPSFPSPRSDLNPATACGVLHAVNIATIASP